MGDLLKGNSARSVTRKQIVAATRGNGREAPRADLYATSCRLPQQTLSSQCCIKTPVGSFCPFERAARRRSRFVAAEQTSRSATGRISLSGHVIRPRMPADRHGLESCRCYRSQRSAFSLQKEQAALLACDSQEHSCGDAACLIALTTTRLRNSTASANPAGVEAQQPNPETCG